VAASADHTGDCCSDRTIPASPIPSSRCRPYHSLAPFCLNPAPETEPGARGIHLWSYRFQSTALDEHVLTRASVVVGVLKSNRWKLWLLTCGLEDRCRPRNLAAIVARLRGGTPRPNGYLDLIPPRHRTARVTSAIQFRASNSVHPPSCFTGGTGRLIRSMTPSGWISGTSVGSPAGTHGQPEDLVSWLTCT